MRCIRQLLAGMLFWLADLLDDRVVLSTGPDELTEAEANVEVWGHPSLAEWLQGKAN